jgi:hypothetical protein
MNGPQAIGNARRPNGQYEVADKLYAIQEILIPKTWVIGYRVGPKGMIWAKREAAVRHAKARMALAERTKARVS